MSSRSLCWSTCDNFESENLQRRLKCTYVGVLSFSSKISSKTLEPLSRCWHKNWQLACFQEGARPCWKVKNIKIWEESSNFFFYYYFLFNIMYTCKQPVMAHYSSTFTVSFYCFLLCWYLGIGFQSELANFAGFTQKWIVCFKIKFWTFHLFLHIPAVTNQLSILFYLP